MRKDLDACVLDGDDKWGRRGVSRGQIKPCIVVRNEPTYDPSTYHFYVSVPPQIVHIATEIYLPPM
jgi:hypothetical protein